MLNYRFVRPLLHGLDPETAHRVAIWGLKRGLGGRSAAPTDPTLSARVFGMDFPNPVGLAAGFDKDAEVMDAMLALGFGFVEAGTVTPMPQPGNPRPRLFRLGEDQAVVNRFGFNSGGLQPFVERLKIRRAVGRRGIVGANVGKNKDTVDGAADYVKGIETVCRYADYLVCNVSSPNTPGLRAMQGRASIEALLQRVLEARERALPEHGKCPPLLVKVGPDLDGEQLRDIAEVALASGIDGLIVGNTTVTRPSGLRSVHAAEEGGLSGKPLQPISHGCLYDMYRFTDGRLPIIGCGGIDSGAAAYARIRAGASLVQMYSALVYHGPQLAERVACELSACLRADGYATVGDAVGADHRKRLDGGRTVDSARSHLT